MLKSVESDVNRGQETRLKEGDAGENPSCSAATSRRTRSTRRALDGSGVNGGATVSPLVVRRPRRETQAMSPDRICASVIHALGRLVGYVSAHKSVTLRAASPQHAASRRRLESSQH